MGRSSCGRRTVWLTGALRGRAATCTAQHLGAFGFTPGVTLFLAVLDQLLLGALLSQVLTRALASCNRGTGQGSRCCFCSSCSSIHFELQIDCQPRRAEAHTRGVHGGDCSTVPPFDDPRADILEIPSMNFLEKLNPEQQEAVLHREGPLLILAGAGSGKTRVITFRIAHLIGDGHAKPDEVLAVTFTNKAAQEMRERVEALIGDDAGGVWLSTFHALCARLLRREAPKIGLTRDFVIYDSSDQVVRRQAGAARARHRRQARAAAHGAVADQPRQEPDGRAGLAARQVEPPRRADRQDLREVPHRAHRQQRARFRRPPAQDGRAVRNVGADAELLRQQVPVRHGRRVPGHQPAAVPADQAAVRGLPQPRRRRRPRSVDLQVARRRPARTSSTSSTTSPKRRRSSSNRTTGRRR